MTVGSGNRWHLNAFVEEIRPFFGGPRGEFQTPLRLVGGIPTPLKNIVSWIIVPNLWEKMFQTTGPHRLVQEWVIP